MSADLERDSHGNEHLHARVRDHTGVQKVVDKELSPRVKGHRSLSPKGKLWMAAVAGSGSDLTSGDMPSDEAKNKERKKYKISAKAKQRENEDIAEEIEEGVRGVVDEVLEKHEKKEKKKKRREPIYRQLGGSGLPAPKSERESGRRVASRAWQLMSGYAYPPAPRVIEQNARQRYLGRLGMGNYPQLPTGGANMGGMGMPGMQGMSGGPGMYRGPGMFGG